MACIFFLNPLAAHSFHLSAVCTLKPVILAFVKCYIVISIIMWHQCIIFSPSLHSTLVWSMLGRYDSLVWWHVVPMCFTSGAVVHIYTSICLPYELWLASFATLLCGSIPWEASGFQLQRHVHCYHPNAVCIDGLQSLPAPIFLYGSNCFMLRAVCSPWGKGTIV